MANLNAPFGGRVINTLVSADFNSKVHTYHTSTADATPIFVGDFVKLTGSSNADGIPYITQASAISNPLVGVVVGIKNIYTNESQLYRAAYTDLEIEVMDDPLAEFEVQYSGTFNTSCVDKTIDLLVGSGNTFTGMSGMQLNSATVTSGKQILILGVLPRSDNVVGAYTKVRCKILNHSYARNPNTVNAFFTAHAGGGQTDAYQTSGSILYINTVATTGDSVMLKPAKYGDVVMVKNAGANSCNIYPRVGEYMGGVLNAAQAVAASQTAIFYSNIEGYWATFVIA